MSDHTNVRKRPALFRALGDAEPPATVLVGGRPFALDTVLKHDSWAATAIYADGSGDRIICKFNRRQPIFGLPMRWLGRRLAARETGFLDRLKHLDLVPPSRGPVHAGGELLDNAASRTFLDGQAFRVAEQVDVAFFRDLRRLLDDVHATDMAYVDLHKRENIIVGTDGRPYLIDFQVSFGTWPGWIGQSALVRAVVRRLQGMDDYHYRKHHARCLPESLTPEERARYLEPPALIRAHRRIAVPLRSLRRRLLVALKVRDRSGQAGSELEPEDAFRPLDDGKSRK